MRADRLISLMMLLQTRGQMTAQGLADELEVSERTIYRDIEALSGAGVPVYAERGPGGGCGLLDSYRTTLTGLNDAELRALFMLNVPAPLSDLGVSQELRSALRKLCASLPVARREAEGRVRQRIYLDWVAWRQPEDPAPYLAAMQQAVWQDRKLRIRLALMFDAWANLIVDPYGLVAKAGGWYLVCFHDGYLHVVRAVQVLEAEVLAEGFVRPADFDLAGYWRDWCAREEGVRPVYPVTLRVSPELMALLPIYLGRVQDLVAQAGPPDDEGWVTLTVPFETFESARTRILGFGAAAEVLAPQPLRESVADFARQIAAFYDARNR